jgi:hypothetical protein
LRPGNRQHGEMTALKVNADNFIRAETHRMMAGLQRDAGGVNTPEILKGRMDLSQPSRDDSDIRVSGRL